MGISSLDLFEYLDLVQSSDHRTDSIREDVWKKFGTTCAPFVLDSSGFTRTTQSEGIVYFLSCVVQMRKLAVPILKSANVLNYRLETDNIFAEFPGPDHALTAAVKIIEAVNLARIRLNDREFYRVGVGIGFGQVLRTEHEGVFGDEMNLASKLGEDLGTGNEIMLTESAFLALNTSQRSQFTPRSVRISGVDINYYCQDFSEGGSSAKQGELDE